MKHQPRPYQLEAVQRTFAYFAEVRDVKRNPLIGLPTGTGKSLCIAGTIFMMLTQYQPNHTFIVLTHDSELVEQDSDELADMWPEAPFGVHCEGMRRRDTIEPVIFATVQSVFATLKEQEKKGTFFNPFGPRMTIIVDEAHMIPPAEDAMYQYVLGVFRCSNPLMRIIGYTATGYRLGMGTLLDGGIFTDWAYNKTTGDDYVQFIRDGYLVPLIPRRTSTEIDTAGVRMRGGDFSEKQLQEASNVERISIDAVREMLFHGQYRRRWLVFTTGIEHCEAVVRILEQHGIDTDFVHSKRKAADNKRAIKAYKAGELRCMVNANKLTTGFNVPSVDLIGMLRPTASPVLHVQMGGRGSRPFWCPEYTKRDCLFLDFAGNVPRLGAINDPVLPRKPGDGGQPAPMKECLKCHSWNHTSLRECFFCGEPFQFQTKLESTSGTHELINGLQPEVRETWDVHSVAYGSVMTKAKKAALRVSYIVGIRHVSELVLLEHDGFAGKQARRWWEKRSLFMKGIQTPLTVAQSLLTTSMLMQPKRITVRLVPGAKFPEIIDHHF